MSKPPKIPGKASKSKQDQASIISQLTTPTAIAAIVMGVCFLGILLAVTGPDESGFVRSSELRNFDAFLKREGVRRKGADIVCNTTSRKSAEGCYTLSRIFAPRGETMMKIPQDLVIDVRTILGKSEYSELLNREEGGSLDTFIKSNNLEQSYYYYIYAHFLVSERNKGSSSHLAEWIAILPKEEELTTGLQWPQSDDECLDEATASELGYFRGVLDGLVRVGEHICENGRCTPFPFEDLRWGMSIYRSRSLQDQAIVIPMDFVNHAQDRANVLVEWNQEDKTLDVKANTNLNKGDELFTHYGYGKSPMSLLVSHGFVEDITSFYPANVNMDLERVPLLKKLGCDRKYEIGYHSSGKPRSVFVQCLTALVMTEEQRGRYKSLIKSDTLELAEINMYTWGNLTYGIQTAAQKTRPSQAQHQKCAERSTPNLALVEQVQRNTMQFLIKSHKHCSEMFERAQKKFVKLGGVLPNPEDEKEETKHSGSTVITPQGEAGEAESP
jgi:hypothetical protein